MSGGNRLGVICRNIVFVIAGALVSQVASASGALSASKTLLSNSSPKTGELVEYRIDLSCSGLTGDCGALSILDNLPPELEIDSCIAPPGFTVNLCDTGTNLIDIVKDTAFGDGEAFFLTIRSRVRLDAPAGGPISNTADVTISTGPGDIPQVASPESGPITIVAGAPHYEILKDRVDPLPPVLPAADTDVSYTVQYCAIDGIGNTDLIAPGMVDTFPVGALLINADGGTLSGVDNNIISWSLDDFVMANDYALPADTSVPFCQSRTYTLRYPSALFPGGAALVNTLQGLGDSGGAFPGPGPDTVTINETIGDPEPNTVTGKYADDVVAGDGPMVWHIDAAVENSNVPLLDLVLYEEIPQTPGAMNAISISSGTWSSPLNSEGQSNVQATIQYTTAAVPVATTATTVLTPAVPTDCSAIPDASWMTLSGGQIASPVTGVSYALPPAATCVRWVFIDASANASAPAIPRGTAFEESPRLSMDTSAVAGPYPVSVENCLYSYMDEDGVSGGAKLAKGPVCAKANIELPTPAIKVSKTRVEPSGDLNAGQEFTQQLTFSHISGDSTGPVVNPVLTDLLPPEVEFIRWDGYTGMTPEPVMEVIQNYASSGRTLIRFSWTASPPAGALHRDLSDASGSDSSASFSETLDASQLPALDLVLQIKAGTPAGAYINQAELFDNSPNGFTCEDTINEATAGPGGTPIDLNGDADSVDELCVGTADLPVINAAALGGKKFVKGVGNPALPNIDDPTSAPDVVDSSCEGTPNGLTRFPCVAQTQRAAPNNTFNYELQLVNAGNVFLEDYYLYDLLPMIGDSGSGPALENSARESTWRPEMAGAITLNAASFMDINGNPLILSAFSSLTIEYTTEANPCRSELEGAFTDPWPAACVENYTSTFPANPQDITAFRIKMPFETLPWPPGASLSFNVPMSAPVGAPPSIAGDPTLFNPAWNSFAHRAREDDGQGGVPTGSAILASEPRKVGIILEPAYRIGNLIWLDANHNGIAESGEPGIANVQIQLWADDGDNVASAGDTLVATTTTDADGKYVFDDLTPGSYYVLVPDGQNGPGGPLSNLFQSTFGEESSPDSDGDNNDNGVNPGATAGGVTTGLSSGVITLGNAGLFAQSEPTNETLRADDATDDDGSDVDLYPDSLSNFSIDIGYYRPFNLGNRVWLDNGDDGSGGITAGNANNGAMDAGESGIDGISVILRAGDGGVYDADPDTAGDQPLTTVTASGGYYLFENLPAGDYRVQLDLAGGFEYLKSSTGGVNGSNIGPYESAVPDPDDDLDLRDDGKHNSATIIESLTVTLGSAALPSEPLSEADLNPALSNGQGDDPSGTGTAIADNQANMTVDFGLYESYSLGNRVWIEDDDNGILDSGEETPDGVPVRLYEDFDLDGNPDGGAIASQTTANGGHYRFDNLSAGTYIVEVDIPAGTRSSQVNAGDPDVDADDNDDNGVDIIMTSVRSDPITLGPIGATEPLNDAESGPGDSDGLYAASDGHSNLSVDFGFVREYSIGSYVWNDLNGDGLQGDPSIEIPIISATVELLDTNGNPVTDLDGIQVPSQNTLVDGKYFFSGLRSGDYKVRVTPPPAYIPSPVQNTTANNDTLNDSNIATVVAAGVYQSELFTLENGLEPIETGALEGDDRDDGADSYGNMSIDFGFYEPLTLGNLVWIDTDNDGLFNNGEVGVNGVEVELYRDDGDAIFEPGADDIQVATTMTSGLSGQDGLYQFNNLLAGDYFVFIPDSNFTAGQPLEQLVSSTGTGGGNASSFEPAPDPDAATVLDNDDSGTRDTANAGVVSAAVTLAANTEPQLEDPTVSGIPGNDGTLVNGQPHDDRDSNLSVDFGFTPSMTIGSVVFSDDDDSGIQESGEMGIANANVRLFNSVGLTEIPVGPDGIFGTADDATGGMSTDSNGVYNFSGLAAGSYIVRVTPDARYAPSTVQVSDPDSDINLDSNIDSAATPPPGSYDSGTLVLLAMNEPTGAAENDVNGVAESDPSGVADNNANLTVDFGFVPPVSIGSFVWLDTNGNSLQDIAEPGIVTATVTLLDGAGAPVTQDLDGAPITPQSLAGTGGKYIFDNLRPGDYRIRVTPTPGSGLTPALLQNGVSNDNTENDSNIATIGAGFYDSATFTLTGGAEPVEAGTVEVGDDQDDTGVIGAIATDDSGNMTVDFGFIRPVSIGSYVWEDSNGNGAQDSGEPFIDGATVALVDTAGNPVIDIDGVQVASIPTAGGGIYQFTNLAPGDYRVRVSPPAGYVNPPTSTQTTGANDDSEADSNIATDLGSGVYESGTFTLSVGGEPSETVQSGDNQDNTAETDGNMTVDFGFVRPLSIGSFVWEDTNSDGIQDSGEPFIDGATVSLVDTSGNGVNDLSGNLVTPVSTASGGIYEFTNLAPGDYRVRVSPPAGYVNPPSYTQTTGDNDDSEADSNIATDLGGGVYESGTFTLSVGGEPSETVQAGDNQDNAAETDGNMTVDFGFVRPLSLGSFVWEDTNGNGVQDSGEPFIDGATVSLVDTSGNGVNDLSGNLVTPVSTASGGIYEFTNLVPGDYRVRVSPPAGYVSPPSSTQTTGDNDDSEADSNIATDLGGGVYESGTFTLSVGGEPSETVQAGDNQDNAAETDGNMTVDFGFVRPLSIGSFVWRDINGDGVQDSGEPGIDGATVELVNASGGLVVDLDGVTVTSQLTAAGGIYQFTNLLPGDYRIRVTPPAGYVDPPSSTQTTANNDDTQGDSNIAGEVSSGTYQSGVFTLTVGGEPTETTEAGDGQDNATETDGNMTVDFGFIRPLSIGSYVWEDTNDNGIQDGSEPAIENAIVTLLDSSNNPVTVDMNGVQILPVTTGPGGVYHFDNLLPGDYRIQVVPPVDLYLLPSFIQTTADNNDADSDSNIASSPVPGTYISGLFTLGVGQEPGSAIENQPGDTLDDVRENDGNMTVDFGFVPALSIGSTVFLDFDNNALHDAGEPGVRGVALELYTQGQVPGTDSPLATTTTDQAGNYLFDNLRQGDYFVYIPTPPVDAEKSSTDIGTSAGDNGTDGDDNGQQGMSGDPVSSPVISLMVRQEPVAGDESATGGNQDDLSDSNGDMTIDFGFTPPAVIGNRVWLDLDRDGVQDGNEVGIPNVTVTLMVDSSGDGTPDTPLETTITGLDGEYLFPGLEPGVAYQVVVDSASLTPGLEQTFDEGPVPGVSGVLDHTSEPIVMDPNQEHLSTDFGYAPPAGSIGDTLWVDADAEGGNGIQDPGEPGIPGVIVNLLDADGNIIDSRVTDEQGHYLFTGLPVGIYGVDIDPASLPAGFIAHPNGDPDYRDGIGFAHDNQTTVSLELLTDGSVGSNLNADFAYLPPLGLNNALGDTVWLDYNGDGVQDSDEPGIPGVTLRLLDSTGETIATTVTNEQGRYQFLGLPDGIFTVVVTDSENVMAGLLQTYDNDGLATPGQSTVDLDSGSMIATPLIDPDQDFGYTPAVNTDPTASGKNGVIGDTVFFDTNGDGSQGAAESGIEGVTVELRDTNGNLIDVAFTDENGNYLFTGLDVSASGVAYTVTVLTDTLPGGGVHWGNSADPDGGMDSTSMLTLTNTLPVNLGQGFGYGGGNNSLSGTLWPDTNEDGVHDEDEYFEGVTIVLLDPDTTNILGHVTTDAQGHFEFTGLPDGRYTFLVTDDDKKLVGYEHTDGTVGQDRNSQRDDGTYIVDLDSLAVLAIPVNDVTSDAGYTPTLTTPITLGSFESQVLFAGEVQFSWTTQSEVANAGFLIYQKVGDEWRQLNEGIIPAVGESLETQRYSYTGKDVEGDEFVLVDVDTRGQQTLHGPFFLGQVFGTPGQLVAESPDWSSLGISPEQAEQKKRVQAQRFKATLESYLGR